MVKRRAARRAWTGWGAGVCMALFVANAHAAAQQIGVVFFADTREAWGKPPANAEQELRYTDPVYHDEAVRTGPSGGTALQFLDTTRLQVGAGSSLVLDSYVFNPDNGKGEAVISFSTGVFRFITGQMSKDGITLRTPTTVMSVRGTKLIIFVAPDGGTQAGVVEGEIKSQVCDTDRFLTAKVGQVFKVAGDCSGAAVVTGTVVVDDPVVVADLPGLSDIAPAAGDVPDEEPEGPPNGSTRSASDF